MRYAVGLMSGTSLDGVDASLVLITDDRKYQLVDYILYPYTEEIKNKILDASSIETSNVQKICSLNFEISHIHVDAIKKLMEKANFNISDVDFIAYHGQTIWHNPTKSEKFVSSTLQIGDASVISYAFNKMVINNFRTADVAAGGEGAPLVPYAIFKLYQDNNKSIAFQNIGGIGNVTYLPMSGKVDDVIAFDTGPGNMLIDGAMKKLFNLPYDEGGKIAFRGKINVDVLNSLLCDEYFIQIPPKSTGREKYNEEYLNRVIDKVLVNGTKEDVITTLSAFTAESIISQISIYLPDIDELIVSGGGAHNEYIMSYIDNNTKYEVKKAEYMDALESLCFVVLGDATINNEPSNIPNVTNAREKVILGSITLPPRR